MLNRHDAVWTSGNAARLLHGPKGNVSRALRRFLANVVMGNYVIQSFAFDEGYSDEQFAAIAEYAKRVDDEQQQYLTDLNVKRVGTLVEKETGGISNVYQLPFDIAKASLKELQAAVRLVVVLGDSLTFFARCPASAAGFDDYHYRGLPSSIAPDDQLWCIGGHDKRGGSGVLEWCYDEADAMHRLAWMQRFPERFTGLKAEPYEGRGAGMHWAVKQALPPEMG